MLPAEGGSSASHQEESRGGGFSSESEPSVEEQHRTLNYNEWAASIRKKKGGSGQGSSGSGSRAA